MAYLRSFEAETHLSTQFVVVPDFIGPNEEILSAGSENGKLHFWDIQTGELVSVLQEHSKHSGCITINHAKPGMIATSSDDNHIIM
jgi:WD40 repeat protein